MAKRARWIIAIGILAVALAGRSAVEYMRLSFRQHRLDRQLDVLQSRHDDLLKRRERFQNDPVYVEGLIRTTFKQARKGEYVIPLNPSQNKVGRTAAAR